MPVQGLGRVFFARAWHSLYPSVASDFVPLAGRRNGGRRFLPNIRIADDLPVAGLSSPRRSAETLESRSSGRLSSHHPATSACYIRFRMGSLFFFLHGWGFFLQAVAIVHFIRRRPDMYWIFVILFLGWIGAAVYIVAEVIPDAGLLRSGFQVFPRRRRIHELERAILDNPSAGNYEELGLLYLDNGDYARARAAYDKAIASRTDSVDAFYRRGVAEVELGEFAAAVPDLERAVNADANYDFHRAKGLLAQVYSQTGQAGDG